MIPLLLSLARGLLPDSFDRLLDTAARLYDEWDDVIVRQTDGWTQRDDNELADAIKATLDELPEPPGFRAGDNDKLAWAIAVIVRWIVHAPPRKRKARKLLRKP